MTATVQPLFDEPWPEAVLRLAQALKRMSEHPSPGDRTRAERDAFMAAKLQLTALLKDPPA